MDSRQKANGDAGQRAAAAARAKEEHFWSRRSRRRRNTSIFEISSDPISGPDGDNVGGGGGGGGRGGGGGGGGGGGRGGGGGGGGGCGGGVGGSGGRNDRGDGEGGGGIGGDGGGNRNDATTMYFFDVGAYNQWRLNSRRVKILMLSWFLGLRRRRLNRCLSDARTQWPLVRISPWPRPAESSLVAA